MPVTVVVGGQYGSEGKGKVAHWLAREQRAQYAIRVGGPNSGHTVVQDGQRFVLRHLPTPVLLDDVIGVVPAGAGLDVDVGRYATKSEAPMGCGHGPRAVDGLPAPLRGNARPTAEASRIADAD